MIQDRGTAAEAQNEIAYLRARNATLAVELNQANRRADLAEGELLALQRTSDRLERKHADDLGKAHLKWVIGVAAVLSAVYKLLSSGK